MKQLAAAMTITRNEPFWLRVWCNYYCSVFPQACVYVLDNSSTDGSVDEIRRLYPQVNIISVPRAQSFDHAWLRDTVQKHQAELLKTYEVVLFAETDEFLIPDLSKHQNIYEYCSAFAKGTLAPGESSLRATGWSIVHQIDSEPSIDRSTDSVLLTNRSSMWKLPSYNKTLITKVPLTYSTGFHLTYKDGNRDVNKPIRDDLSLMHGWMIDVDMYHERHVARTNSGAKGHHGSSNLEDVKKFFRTHLMPWDTRTILHIAHRYDVPDVWKTLLRY